MSTGTNSGPASLKILVTGGAGYVGSAACAWLLDQGHEVHVLDDLSAGHRELALGSSFTQARVGDRAAVEKLLSSGPRPFDCVMHFAAKAVVSESVSHPEMYFENNVEQTQKLLDTMLHCGVKKFIFSSTCAVFGDPGSSDIHEDLPKKPINPYGETKLTVEKHLQKLASERGLQSVALRYFNAAGTEPAIRVGERHHPETHLIPNLLKAAGGSEVFQLFGTNHPTPDGTCVRDYIHVSDLAQAHEAAMLRLAALPTPSNGAPGQFESFNIGSEKGYSVREVLAACERATGQRIPTKEQPARAGDPPRLVADSARAHKELGFKPRFSLDDILKTAWCWHRKQQGSLDKAVFLDRDGTINIDPGYIGNADLFKLQPNAAQGLRKLQDAGYKLIIVSNQSGVARGLIPKDELPRIHARMEALLAEHGVKIDHYSLCLHHPDERCGCRKPKPTLIYQAVRDCGVDPARSYMIGDRQSDLLTGRNAHCRGSVLVRTGLGNETVSRKEHDYADFIADDLVAAADWILSR